MRARQRFVLVLVCALVAFSACSPDSDTAAPDTTEPQTTTTTVTSSTTSTPTTEAPTTTTVASTVTTAEPTITDLDAGLFCRDLHAMGFEYPEAVAYWMLELRPDRMDADTNGIPCETVYPQADVVEFWGELDTEADVFYSIAKHGMFPEPLPGSDGQLGSGCAPGSDTLPDGIWYGYIRGVSASEVMFDLACLSIGESAPGPDDFGGWVYSNTSPTVRTVPLDLGIATCPWQDCPGEILDGRGWFSWATDFIEMNPSAREYNDGQPGGLAVWLYVNDGAITEIVQPVLAG